MKKRGVGYFVDEGGVVVWFPKPTGKNWASERKSGSVDAAWETVVEPIAGDDLYQEYRGTDGTAAFYRVRGQ